MMEVETKPEAKPETIASEAAASPQKKYVRIKLNGKAVKSKATVKNPIRPQTRLKDWWERVRGCHSDEEHQAKEAQDPMTDADIDRGLMKLPLQHGTL